MSTTSTPAPRRRLPWLTRFVGRVPEIAALESVLDGARLVTLVGPPGAGKSRLGVEVADRVGSRFAAGVRFVELAPLTDPRGTAGAIGSALGVAEQPGRPMVDTLAETLVDQEVLLVLDNCEHLVAEAADVVHRLLAECPSVRVLATSRVRLQLAGEQVWNVRRLDEATAVDLFLDRARLATNDFPRDDASQRLVREICAHLDGLPLAIELAAAWTRVLSPTQIVERLDRALPLPRSGIRTGTPHHETMDATVERSYELLDTGAQALFEVLSVFAGGFDLPAAEAVAAPGDDVLTGLTSLVDHSLVLADPVDVETMRYCQLEPVRQCGARRLVARSDHDDVRARHAEHYLQVARRAAGDLHGDRRGAALRRLGREEGNLLVALDWARARRSELGLRLATALAPFWELGGRVNDGRAWLDQMLAIDAPDRALRGTALARAGRLAWRQRHYAQARRMLEDSLDIARELGDAVVVARRQRNLALVPMTEGDTATATALCEQSITACRAHGDETGLVWGLIFLGLTCYVAGDLAAGDRHIDEALTLNRRVGSVAATVAGNLYLSYAANRRGDVAAERTHVVEVMAAMRQPGGIVEEPDWLWAGAALAAGEGRNEAALRLAGAAQALSRRTGSYINEQFMVELEQVVAEARRRVGRGRSDRLTAEGAAMTLEELMDEAEATAGEGAEHPLTPREIEVAELVGQGLSNLDIAQRLYISHRTVESHVEHIKRKLAVTTRHQIVMWVLGEPAAEASGSAKTEAGTATE
jgi:predicted ATPase/DNA-binding CsgD family transcriptional regulator